MILLNNESLSCRHFLAFFSSGVISPVTAELATVSRNIDGVGCASLPLRVLIEVLTVQKIPDAHVYGAFNLVYGIGTCS